MYGGLWVFPAGTFDNPYYHVALRKPSPLTDAFDMKYFSGILQAPGAEKLTAKALLATEQRIPGLGNGVLQDILWNAGLHPKRKAGTLGPEKCEDLFLSVRSTLREMLELGGREAEKDLFGNPGGYTTLMGRNAVGKPCPRCGGAIARESYMGGTVTFCPGCQKLE
jgi:formamidopyrimidine-DNA glycosylase